MTGCGDLIDDFGFSLIVLARAHQAAVSAALQGVPHGPRGYQTLAAVAHGEGPNQLALATYLGIDRTVMTYVIDDLVAAGLVERRLNPADRRERKIVATAKGNRTLRALERKVHEAEDEILGPLAADERSTLRNLLSRTARQVKESSMTPCEAAEGLY